MADDHHEVREYPADAEHLPELCVPVLRGGASVQGYRQATGQLEDHVAVPRHVFVALLARRCLEGTCLECDGQGPCRYCGDTGRAR